MKIITPIEIAENMINSPILEPDVDQGEVEWIDGRQIYKPTTINGFKIHRCSALGSDGVVYFGGNAISYIEPDGTAIVGINTPTFSNTAEAYGNFIYFGGDDGVIYKYSVTSRTFSTINTTGAGDLNCSSSGGDGTLYFGGDGSVVVLDADNGDSLVVHKDGLNSQSFYAATIGNDGNLYLTSYSTDSLSFIYRFDTDSFSGSKFIDLSGKYLASELGLDGDIYLVGTSGKVGKVNITLTSVSYFSTLYGKIYGITATNNGNFYAYGELSTGQGVIYVVEPDIGNAYFLTNTAQRAESINSMTYNQGNYYFTLGISRFGWIRPMNKAGDQVIKSSTHKVYQAITDNYDDPEFGVDLIPPSWVELYATNKYRMFDYVINTESSGDGDLMLTPNETATTISMFGLSNVSEIKVEVREDDDAGDLIYSSTKDLSLITPISDLISSDAIYQSKAIFDDLPTYSQPWIKVTATNADPLSNWGIGDIVLGNAKTMGKMTYLSSTSRTSYDTVELDEFGNQTTISRPSAEYTTFEMVVFPQYSDYVERILKDSLNKPCVYVGDKQNGEKIFTFGYYERSPISYDDPSLCTTTLKVRGLV